MATDSGTLGAALLDLGASPRTGGALTADPVAPRSSLAPGTPTEPSDPDPRDPGDHDLVQRARAGDGTALGALARRHRAALHGFIARRIGDRDAAEDLVQETLLRAVAHLDRLDQPGAFAGWLYRIAGRLCADHHRRGPAPLARLDLDPPPDPRSRTPSAVFAAAQRDTDLADRVAALPLTQRTAVELRHHAGLRCREIAVAMGTSVGAVTKWLSRAYDTLRGSVDE